MYKCNACGYTSVAWMGKCPSCGSFDIMQVEDVKKVSKSGQRVQDIKILNAGEVFKQENNFKLQKLSSGFKEVDRVLNLITKGGVYLLGGEPGVGKSTLALQILGNLAQKGEKVLYVTGEESYHQVAMRAKRLFSNKLLENIDIVANTDLVSVLENIKNKHYSLIVFDSMQAFQIQANNGVVGGVSQIRDVVYKIVQFAKTQDVSVFIIGQITKEGIIAGPKLAEHIVDVVAYLENIGSNNVRILRVIKNRFGDTGNIGFLRLTEQGFVDAVDAYTEWINTDLTNAPGVGIGIVMYGTRPLMVQVQSLIVDTKFSNPKRVVEGIARSKLELLVAVVDKHVPGINLGFKDIFVKIIGGINTKDSCIDLAILASLISSYKQKPFGKHAFVGEVGLLGDIKSCAFKDSYKKEAERLGFKLVQRNTNLKFAKDLLRLLKHAE